MTKKNLIWQLDHKPTVDELRELVKDEIITKEEAKEVLFREEDEQKRPQKSEIEDLKNELKLLREMFLSIRGVSIQPIVIEKIIEVEKYPWIRPYTTWATTHFYDNQTGNKMYCNGTTNLKATYTVNAIDIK